MACLGSLWQLAAVNQTAHTSCRLHGGKKRQPLRTVCWHALHAQLIIGHTVEAIGGQTMYVCVCVFLWTNFLDRLYYKL
jgi:hypothetical protein